MSRNEPLQRKREEIREAWIRHIVSEYPAESGRFIRRTQDRFRNPIGETIEKGTAAVLDGLIEGRDYIAGDKPGLADILLFCFVNFGTTVGQPLNTDNKNITAWFERMKARPSASA